MKITQQLLRNIAEHIERNGDDLGIDFPAAETIFGWLIEFVAIEIEDEASGFRCAPWRVRK